MSRHLTEEQICRAIAGQSTLDEHRHAQECAACHDDIAGSWQMLAAFRHDVVVRAERQPMRSTTSFHADVHATRTAVTSLRSAWALAGVVLLAVALALVWQLRTASSQRPGQLAHTAPAAGHGADMTDRTVDAINEFYPLAYSNLPVTNGRIIRIEVPRSAPIAFGLDPINLVSSAPGAVLADVVVGEDGLARAVRFVRPLAGASQTYVKEP